MIACKSAKIAVSNDVSLQLKQMSEEIVIAQILQQGGDKTLCSFAAELTFLRLEQLFYEFISLNCETR